MSQGVVLLYNGVMSFGHVLGSIFWFFCTGSKCKKNCWKGSKMQKLYSPTRRSAGPMGALARASSQRGGRRRGASARDPPPGAPGQASFPTIDGPSDLPASRPPEGAPARVSSPVRGCRWGAPAWEHRCRQVPRRTTVRATSSASRPPAGEPAQGDLPGERPDACWSAVRPNPGDVWQISQWFMCGVFLLYFLKKCSFRFLFCFKH